MKTPASKDTLGKGDMMVGANALLSEQRRLLQMEYESEKKAFADAASNVGLIRLTERGDAWFPVKIIADRRNALDRRVIDIIRLNSDKENEPAEHNFEYGKPVMIFSTENKTDSVKIGRRERYGHTKSNEAGSQQCRTCCINGTLNYVDDTHMVIYVISQTRTVSNRQSCK